MSSAAHSVAAVYGGYVPSPDSSPEYNTMKKRSSNMRNQQSFELRLKGLLTPCLKADDPAPADMNEEPKKDSHYSDPSKQMSRNIFTSKPKLSISKPSLKLDHSSKNIGTIKSLNTQVVKQALSEKSNLAAMQVQGACSKPSLLL